MRRRALNVLPSEEKEELESLRDRVREFEALLDTPETVVSLRRQVAAMEEKANKAIEAHARDKQFLEQESARLARMAQEISEEQARIEQQSRHARENAILYREMSPERQTFPDDGLTASDINVFSRFLGDLYALLRDPMKGDGRKVGECYQLVKKMRETRLTPKR